MGESHATPPPVPNGENRELDPRVWEAWLDRNAKRDYDFFLKVKVGGAVFLVLTVGFLLWWLF